MVRLALGDSDKLKASDIEFKLRIPSYTIDTLTYLHEKYTDRKFCLVMGQDNLYTLHKWKNYEELVTRFSIYVYPRPYSLRPESPVLDHILSIADVHQVDAPMMDISSTFIREGIKAGKDMSYFVPPATWKYIREMHFYEK
jgi:nicotinate-nucleotide adenylyltransferase